MKKGLATWLVDVCASCIHKLVKKAKKNKTTEVDVELRQNRRNSPNSFMFIPKCGLIMAKEVRYTYNGKEVGTLRKLVSDVVVLEEQWINSC